MYRYMFNIFEEISWPQFAQMSHVAKLPLQEQVTQYNQYLFQLEEARMNWIDTQSKGPQGIVNIGLLAQQAFSQALMDEMAENGKVSVAISTKEVNGLLYGVTPIINLDGNME